MKLVFEKLDSLARLPGYAHPGDAGMDLFSAEDKSLAPGEIYLFKLGVKAAIPEGHFVSFRDKSSLGLKGIKVMGGVIDSGYRGEWMVVLTNLSQEAWEFKTGDKLAQALLQPVASPEVEEGQVEEATARGAGGFGSTGR